MARRIIAWSTTIAGALASLLLIVFGDIYLAINPAFTVNGLVKLVPPPVQPNVSAMSGDAALALKGWLAGQAIGMLLVGAFTGLGLWLVGVPSALALGFLPASLFAPLGPL